MALNTSSSVTISRQVPYLISLSLQGSEGPKWAHRHVIWSTGTETPQATFHPHRLRLVFVVVFPHCSDKNALTKITSGWMNAAHTRAHMVHRGSRREAESNEPSALLASFWCSPGLKPTLRADLLTSVNLFKRILQRCPQRPASSSRRAWSLFPRRLQIL